MLNRLIRKIRVVAACWRDGLIPYERLIVFLFRESDLGRKGIRRGIFEEHFSNYHGREEKKNVYFSIWKIVYEKKKKSEGHNRPTFLLDSREKEGWSLNIIISNEFLRMWTASRDLKAYSLFGRSFIYIYIFRLWIFSMPCKSRF